MKQRKTIYCDKWLLEEIERLSEQNDRTANGEIIHAIRCYVTYWQAENPVPELELDNTH